LHSETVVHPKKCAQVKATPASAAQGTSFGKKRLLKTMFTHISFHNKESDYIESSAIFFGWGITIRMCTADIVDKVSALAVR